ncbi:hypothetical protein BJV74DRAFT_880595 [Russula compacta]|nr:hypothetical protein BJV74DRAFT_880595 [Russula compacta]
MSTHVQGPGQDPSPSASSSRKANATNDISPSGPASDFQLDGIHYDVSQLNLQYQGFTQAPLDSLQHPIPVLPINSGHVYGGDPYRAHGSNNAAAPPASWVGGGPPQTPYGQAMPINAGVNSGQTGRAEANFAGQPPIVACPPGLQPLDPYARLNAQGIPTPLWQPFKTWLEYDGGDYIRQVMIYKKARFA